MKIDDFPVPDSPAARAATDVATEYLDDTLLGDFRREVLVAYPWLGLAAEFGSCVTAQAERKPMTSAARLISGGLVRKLAENPLEDLGY